MGADDIPVCQGVTDSEKRVQHLTLENEALKQSLNLTRDLLLHWGPGPLPRPPQVLCPRSLYIWHPAAVPEPPQTFMFALVVAISNYEQSQ